MSTKYRDACRCIDRKNRVSPCIRMHLSVLRLYISIGTHPAPFAVAVRSFHACNEVLYSLVYSPHLLQMRKPIL